MSGGFHRSLYNKLVSKLCYFKPVCEMFMQESEKEAICLRIAVQNSVKRLERGDLLVH